jgi:hypothetical protein
MHTILTLRLENFLVRLSLEDVAGHGFNHASQVDSLGLFVASPSLYFLISAWVQELLFYENYGLYKQIIPNHTHPCDQVPLPSLLVIMGMD